MGRRETSSHVRHQLYPCLHCHPKIYIRMVQHLIEKCLLLRMTREDCVQALAKHASIRPRITITVWGELMKENRDFFLSYFQQISARTLSYPKVESSPYQLAEMPTTLRRKQQWR